MFKFTKVALSIFSLLHVCTGMGTVEDWNYTLPQSRYIQWDLLSLKLGKAATALGYKDKTWNLPGEADIEYESYETINMTASELMPHIETLEINEESWDCYINHYYDYDWNELEEEEVEIYWEALGWSEAAWNETAEPPETDDWDWADFTDEAQLLALDELCYFKELWDELKLTEWDPNYLDKALRL